MSGRMQETININLMEEEQRVENQYYDIEKNIR